MKVFESLQKSIFIVLDILFFVDSGAQRDIISLQRDIKDFDIKVSFLRL